MTDPQLKLSVAAPRWAALLLCTISGLALAATGGKDAAGYRGIDSLAPAPTLPASHLTLMVGAQEEGQLITDTPLDDAFYALSPQGIAPYNEGYGTLQVSTNGYVSSNAGIAWFDNQPLPDTRFGSHQLIAPYFDDLLAVEGTSTITYGYTAGQFIYVQWNEFALYEKPDARLTFRVTFGAPGPSWVLFQYIKLTGADGSSATIGIQATNTSIYNQYSHDEAVLPSGTATAGQSLFAVLFHVDVDGDLLPAQLESTLGSSDNSFDTDSGGVSDVREFLDGTSLTDATGETAAADADADGLSDADEALFGTLTSNPDTDGDGLNDFEEVNVRGTDPTRADTDGDGRTDQEEVTDGTSALNAQDFQYFNFGTAASKHKAQSVLDPDGNVHAVAYDSNTGGQLFYYHFKADGELLIAETAIQIQSTRVRSPGIAYADGKVFLTYEETNSGKLGVVGLNPAADDRDGDAASFKAIRLFDRLLDGPTNARHHAVASGPNGIHIVYETHPNTTNPDGQKQPRSVGYVLVGFDGAVQSSVVLHEVAQRSLGDGQIHKWSGPRVAVDADGVAHVVFYFQSKPSDGAPVSGLYYAAVEGARVSGPHYLGPANLERAEVALRGELLYIGMSGGCAGETQGVRLGILDVQSYSVSARENDPFDVTSAVSGGFVLPITTISSDGDCNNGAGLTVLESGNAVLYFAEDRNSKVCLVGASPQGQRLGQVRCFFDGSANDRTRNKNLLDLGGGKVGVAFDNRNSEFGYYPIPLALMFDDTEGGLGTINRAPAFSTQPPNGQLGEGQTLTYAAAATDAETAAGDLVWSLLPGAPEGLTLSSTGALSWPTGLGDAGGYTVGIKVCDTGTPARCTTQQLDLSVRPAQAPVITSLPSDQATVGLSYNYQVVAVDPDQNIASYTLVQPVGSSMVLGTDGMLQWTPTAEELGTVAVVIAVADSTGLTDQQSFSVTVLPNTSALAASGCGCASTRGSGVELGLLFLGLGLWTIRRRQRNA